MNTYSLYAGDVLLGVISEELEVLKAHTGLAKDRNAVQYLVDQVTRGKTPKAQLMVRTDDDPTPIPLTQLIKRQAA